MRYYEFIFEGIEDRIALLAKQQGAKIVAAAIKDRSLPNVKDETANPVEILTALAEADPTDGKMLTFLTKLYVAGNFMMEDVSGMKELLTKFNTNKQKLRAAGKPIDIMQYKSKGELFDAISQVEGSGQEVVSKKKAANIKKQEGADTVFSGAGIEIKQLKSKEAACLYGKGTMWCTAATSSDNMFDRYSKEGDIYVIILPNENRKFQFHYESGQFMNEKDENISKSEIALLSKYPEYRDFLNFQIKKHYGKYFDDVVAESRKRVGSTGRKMFNGKTTATRRSLGNSRVR